MTDKTQRYNEHAESIAMKLGALQDWLQWQSERNATWATESDIGGMAHVDELLSQLCESLMLEVEI